jgi:hypothetical protein
MHRFTAALTLVVTLALGACSDDERHAIIIRPDQVSVINTTTAGWSGVEVWLNDHYRVQAPALAAGQRLDIPITVFVAGFGQRFDPKRQTPFGIEVSAKGADGKPVKLVWGQGRRR